MKKDHTTVITIVTMVRRSPKKLSIMASIMKDRKYVLMRPSRTTKIITTMEMAETRSTVSMVSKKMKTKITLNL
jgi:hypothetical protein